MVILNIEFGSVKNEWLCNKDNSSYDIVFYFLLRNYIFFIKVECDILIYPMIFIVGNIGNK